MLLDSRELGERIRSRRELRGVTLGALADTAGVAKSNLSRIESGETGNPGVRTLSAIARALETTVAALLTENEPLLSAPPAPQDWDFARLVAEMPASLREFVREKQRTGGRIPADVLRSLASIQYQGQRPESVADWSFLYEALIRSVGGRDRAAEAQTA